MEGAKKVLQEVNRGISDFYDLDFAKGEINLRQIDARALILPAAAWSTLRDELVRAFKGGAFPLMFQIGYPIGSTFMERFKKLDPHPEIAMKALPEIGASSGWGSFSILGDVKDGSEIILRVANCPFCSKMNETGLPVCDFLAGVFNGMVDTLYDKPHEARETRCESAQGEFCEVVARIVPEKSDEQKRWGTYVLFPWLAPSRSQ